MDTTVSDARQKLFDLRKKYSAVSLKKYETKISSSNESLIDVSDSSIPSQVKEKDNNKKDVKSNEPSSFKSDSSRKNNKSFHSLVESSEEQFNEDPLKERVNCYESKVNDIKSVTKLSLHSDVVSNNSSLDIVSDKNDIEVRKILENKSSSSGSSVVKSTNVEDDNPSEIEEILSDEAIESSSINEPFANIHLVSDDILEDLDSSVGSHSSIKDEGHTGRLSAVLSVKSLQLSSPLEPPRQEYDYDSDFESSENENESFNSVSEIKPDDEEPKPAEFMKNNALFIQDKIDTGKEVTSDNTSKDQSTDKQILNIKSSSDYVKFPSNKIEIESTVRNSLTSDIRSKSKTLEKSGLSNHTSTDDYNESIPEVFEDDEKINNESSHSTSEESKNYSKLSENIIRHESFKKLNSKFSSPVISKEKIRQSIRATRNDVGINVNLSNLKINKNIAVQTSDRLVSANTKYEDIRPHIRSSLKEKWYINTNVRSSKHRPIVKSSKLFKSSNENEDYNPFLFSVQDGLPVDKLVNEILRNQIAMTKYFVNCHHQLYLQCCKTVKSLNKDYKKNQTPIFM